MKGIILAAGVGSRLYPATFPVSKTLLPIYDRPMIYYPLSTLMMMGIRDVLLISNERDLDNFKRALGDGSQFGIKIEYDLQRVQRGISDAFIIAEKWINGENVALILGDNIFCGEDLEQILKEATDNNEGATIFGYPVPDPERFGVIEFDDDMIVTSLEEKPLNPKSNYAVVGIYFYDNKVCSIAKTLKPSVRGELEITDLNNVYLGSGKLSVKLFDKKIEWIDAGTFDSLLKSSIFVANEEKKRGKKILCPEIIAYKKGFVSKKQIIEWISKNTKNEYFLGVKEMIENE